MAKIKPDTRNFIIIYAVALGIMLYYNLTHNLVNDSVYEYQGYLANIQSGWQQRNTLVNSCIMTTWLPAMIQRGTNLDALTLFKVFPAVFYALMPPFAYLIARRYLNVKYALVATLVILFSSYIVYYPEMGRIGVAVAFLAGMIWALLESKLPWAITFGVLVVFSHYGTASITVAFLGLVCLILLIKKHRELKNYAIVFGVVLALTGVWHFGIAYYSGNRMWETFLQLSQTGYSLPQYTLGTVGGALIDPKTREPAVQSALGIGFTSMSIPQKIEVVANWLIVIGVTSGLYFVLRRKSEFQLKIVSLSLWVLVLFTAIVPWLSTYYGAIRVYFTGSMVLAMCFPIGIEKVANKLHMPPLVLMGIIVVLYGLSTSGIIYHPFGLEKTFTIVASYP